MQSTGLHWRFAMFYCLKKIMLLQRLVSFIQSILNIEIFSVLTCFPYISQEGLALGLLAPYGYGNSAPPKSGSGFWEKGPLKENARAMLLAVIVIEG